MNNRFYEISSRTSIDRSAFGNNTRQDKDWANQMKIPQTNNEITNYDVNFDRHVFNTSTNKYATMYNKIHNIDTSKHLTNNKNEELASRNFSEYAVAHSIHNRNTNENAGRRINITKTRENKIILDTNTQNRTQQTVNTNPYQKTPPTTQERLQIIDTKNLGSSGYKQTSTDKKKFNPFIIYN